ncbi:MAG: hypothetical protein JWO62_2910 [Acidimicrobiaceae bacterium]|nr:hypothetical protein [Acidimicrobiaceae bacterium]
MIVRVLEEAQYELDDANTATLNKLDGVLGEALRSGDAETFEAALSAIIDEVRSSGHRLDPTTIVPSDLALPRPGATLEEVRQLLQGESAPPVDDPAV